MAKIPAKKIKKATKGKKYVKKLRIKRYQIDGDQQQGDGGGE